MRVKYEKFLPGSIGTPLREQLNARAAHVRRRAFRIDGREEFAV